MDLSCKSSKKILSKSDEEKWNELSNEEKFSDTFGRLPLAVLATAFEMIIVGGIAAFIL